jgi:hypothetical protein
MDIKLGFSPYEVNIYSKCLRMSWWGDYFNLKDIT